MQQMSDITLSDHLSDRVDRAHEELSNCSSYLEDTRAAIGKLMLVKDKDLIFERMLSNRKDELEWLSAMEQVRNAALYMAQLELQEASSGDLDQFHHTDETASDQDVLEGKDTFETMQDSVAPVSERMPPVIDPPRTLCCVDGNVTNATHPIATADRNADWRSWFGENYALPSFCLTFG